MVLVDTSIWIEHLRKGLSSLEKLLIDMEVMCHQFITGELACGNIRNREEFLSLVQALPVAPVIEHDEFLYFIEMNKLMGQGAGFVDVHLLASAIVSDAFLWTADKNLKRIAEEMAIAFK